jgi:hypothetical protein
MSFGDARRSGLRGGNGRLIVENLHRKSMPYSILPEERNKQTVGTQQEPRQTWYNLKKLTEDRDYVISLLYAKRGTPGTVIESLG